MCVPTPMKKDGTQDFSYIEKMSLKMQKKDFILLNHLIPGSTKKLQEKFILDIV